jgi:hypothetical protein
MAHLIESGGDQIEMGTGSVRLAGAEFTVEGNSLICAFRNPEDENLGVAVLISEDPVTLRSLARRIPHYSNYSYVGFTGARATLRGTWETRNSPLMAKLEKK